MHHINPILARNLLETHFDFCLSKLKQPGKMIVTETECNFQTPK